MDVTPASVTISSLVQMAMAEEDRTVSSLARLIGTSRETLRDRLNDNNLSAEDLLRIADVLHRPVEEFNPKRNADEESGSKRSAA